VFMPVVLHWNTCPRYSIGCPDEGVVLTKRDLERIFSDLRALIDGTGPLEANRAHAVDIAITLAHALERDDGES
jgi:hypothetical protein